MENILCRLFGHKDNGGCKSPCDCHFCLRCDKCLNPSVIEIDDDETDAEVEKTETVRDLQAPDWPQVRN